METKDHYKTIKTVVPPVLFKDRNSKFHGYAFPINNEKELKAILHKLRKEHSSAQHCCYAYQIGVEAPTYRVNDDGEPNNSAGTPIHGQIKSFELTNILVVVIRYFGGVKLGVSGLINAYRTTAHQILESADIVERTININYRLEFDYMHMSKVMYLLKTNRVNIIKQHFEQRCLLEISVRKCNSTQVFEIFNTFFGISITEL